MRGLLPADKCECKVGVTETSHRESRHHTLCKNFILYDLPRVGAPNFPRQTYLQVTEFDKKYDFFLIITKTRFTEKCLWLAQEVEGAGKVYFLVRTQLDEDLKNERTDNPKAFVENNVIRQIRNDCEGNLQSSSIPNNI